MTSPVEVGVRSRLKAPLNSGDCLIEPAVGDWDFLLQENHRLRMMQPQPIAGWRTVARQELLVAALRFTGDYRNVNPPANSDRMILAGHQPTLFHPGVWFKNFVLSQLGRRYSAVAIQLIIDNDLYRNAAIRLPAGSISQPGVAQERFDRIAQAVPFEISRLSDESAFLSFGDRVARTMQPFVLDPIIKRYWPLVIQAQRRVVNIGQALAEARHAIEADSGLETLELPLSHACKMQSFRRFAAHVIFRGPAFAAIHNRCLAEFRTQHRLRSPSHPVPDLLISPTECETPFWVWSMTSPIRRRLYVRSSGRDWILFDRHRLECRVGSEDALAEQLGHLESQGIVIRPRALMTTMYSRMVLSDMFVHGIGGAVYDAVTDEIASRFFGCEPSKFVTATATVHLPIPCPEVDDRDLVRLGVEQRNLVYHPEKYADLSDPATCKLIDSKRAWIENVGPDTNLHARHDAIDAINHRLLAALQGQLGELQARRVGMSDDVRRAKVLGSREYSFVLFPNALIEQLRCMIQGTT